MSIKVEKQVGITLEGKPGGSEENFHEGKE